MHYIVSLKNKWKTVLQGTFPAKYLSNFGILHGCIVDTIFYQLTAYTMPTLLQFYRHKNPKRIEHISHNVDDEQFQQSAIFKCLYGKFLCTLLF